LEAICARELAIERVETPVFLVDYDDVPQPLHACSLFWRSWFGGVANVIPMGPANIAAAVKAALLRFTRSMNNCRRFIVLIGFAGIIAARRYKQITTSQKNGDVSVAIM